MKLLDKLFGRDKQFTAPSPVTSAVFNGDFKTTYAMTDEGLQALVQGKLACEQSERPGLFFVYYDSIVYDLSANKILFCWKHVAVTEITVPVVGEGNTLTVAELQGKLPMEIVQ